MITKAISDPAVDSWTQGSGVLGVARNREADRQSRDCRRETRHPGKFKPELLPDGTSQVWMREITKLRLARSKGVRSQSITRRALMCWRLLPLIARSLICWATCARRQPVEDFRISVPASCSG
jgi:hypothetical protein